MVCKQLPWETQDGRKKPMHKIREQIFCPSKSTYKPGPELRRCQETQIQWGVVETVLAIQRKILHIPVYLWQHSRSKGAGWEKENEIQGLFYLSDIALSSVLS